MKNMLYMLLAFAFICSTGQGQKRDVQSVITHPMLFFSTSDIPQIVNRINQANSAASQLYANVVRQSNYFLTNPLFHPNEYPHNKAVFYHCILSLAFRYIVEKQNNVPNYIQWADRAKFLIFNPTDNNLPDVQRLIQQGIVYDNWPGRQSDPGRALSQQTISLSILYDWLYEQLDANQKLQIQNAIISDLAWTNNVPTYPSGIRAAFTREDAYRIRLEWAPPALLLGAMSIYGENTGYTTTQADADINAALDYEFRTSTSYINRYFSPYDGAHSDGITYPLWGGHLPTMMLDAWSKWDGANHWNDQNIKDRLSKMGEWLAYNVLPDPQTWPCSFNVLNDAYAWHYSPMSILLTLSTKYPEKTGINRWVFNHTIQNIQNLLQSVSFYSDQQEVAGCSMAFILPIIEGYTGSSSDAVEPSTLLPRSKDMIWNGEVHLRTSSNWGDANDIQFVLTSEPAVSPIGNATYQHHHDHPDKNHFTLSAFGDLYTHGYGYGNPEQAPEYHNQILIDDGTGGSNPHWKGEAYAGYLSGQISDGKIVQHATSSQFDFIHGDATRAYNELRWGVGQSPVIYSASNPGPNPLSFFNTVEWAHRYVTFSRSLDNIPAYFIIADDIQKDGNNHKYSWRFHSPKTRSISNPTQVRLSGTNGNYLDLWFTAASSLSQTESVLPQHQSSGSVAMPDADMTTPTTCDGYQLSATDKYTATPVINPYFHVALIPYKSGSGNATPTYTSLAITNGNVVSLAWSNGYTDYSVFKYQNSLQVSGQGVTTDAKLSRIRFVTSSGVVSSFIGAEGTTLTYNGQELINLYGQQGTVMKSGTNVDLTGSSVTYFRVYAPNATAVKLNGQSTGFVQVGNYVESNNVTVDRTWAGNISTQYPVTVAASKTLRIDPASTFKIGSGYGITVNGKLAAIGTTAQRITFTSSSAAPLPGDWQGIVCSGGGPDTLQYCDIKYAATGLSLTNTAANSYMYNDTISSSSYSGYGVFASNTGTASTALTMYKCGIKNNDGRALHINNAKVKVTYSRIENNTRQLITSAILVANGGIAYFDSCRIQNDNGAGIDVTGLNSKVSLSPDEIKGGYNTLYQHGVSEIYVHNSATAILGYTAAVAYCNCPGGNSGGSGLTLTAACPPGCTQQYNYYPRAGYNNIYNTYSYTGRLINNGNTGTQQARYNYWGTGPSGGFIGTVDTTYRLGGSIATPSRAVPIVIGTESNGGPLTRQAIAEWLFGLKQEVEAGSASAYEAMHFLSTHVGPGGEYENILPVSWDNFLSGVEASSVPARLRVLAATMRLKARMDRGEFTTALSLADNILSRNIDNDTWLFCQSRKIVASVAQGDLEGARSMFTSIRQRAIGIDTSTTRAIGEYLALAQIGAPGGTLSDPSKPLVDHTLLKPSAYALSQNYPNPFNPVTRIEYSLPEEVHVSIKIYDVLGQEVKTLVEGVQDAGYKSVTFDASSFPSGLYFYRLQAGRFNDIKKMMLLK